MNLRLYLLFFAFHFRYLLASKEKNKTKDLDLSHSEKIIYHYVPTPSIVPSYSYTDSNEENQHHPNIDKIPGNHHQHSLESALQHNPLLAALYLSTALGIPQTSPGFNHPQHPPVNPYVALLLSHYGRYISVPYTNMARGIYGYVAANNYHNNKPFGAYKVYEDA